MRKPTTAITRLMMLAVFPHVSTNVNHQLGSIPAPAPSINPMEAVLLTHFSALCARIITRISVIEKPPARRRRGVVESGRSVGQHPPSDRRRRPADDLLPAGQLGQPRLH